MSSGSTTPAQATESPSLLEPALQNSPLVQRRASRRQPAPLGDTIKTEGDIMLKAGYMTPERARELDEAAARRRDQDRLLKLATLRKACGVYDKFLDANLDSVEYPRSRLDDVRFTEYIDVRDQLRRLTDFPCTVVLRGQNGPGKTYLASALVNLFCEVEAAELEPRRYTGAHYTTAADFFLELQSTFNVAGRTKLELLDKYRRYRLLVLDEIEVRSDSAWENNVLRGLIDRRYASPVATVIITNKPAAEINTYFSAAIRDRIRSDGAILNCDWPSLRGRR